MSELELVAAAQAGNQFAAETLLTRYAGFIASLADGFFDPTGEREDLLQEARVGAVKAIRDFRPDGGASFKGFLALCVRRQIVTQVKYANTYRQRSLTETVRVARGEDGDEVAAVELALAPEPPVPVLVADREEFQTIAHRIRTVLSDREARCLLLWVTGYSYDEIQTQVGAVSFKSVDNAIQRARRKLAA